MLTKNRYVRGAAVGAGAGVVATATMSVLMVASRKARLTPQLPPGRIAEDAATVAMGSPPTHEEEQAIATAAHFGFGAAMGALFGLVYAALSWPGAAAATGLGLLFGNVVYLLSYQGWVPALGIMPPASRDHPGRVATMLLGHWVYGGVLGAVTAVLVSRRRERQR